MTPASSATRLGSARGALRLQQGWNATGIRSPVERGRITNHGVRDYHMTPFTTHAPPRQCGRVIQPIRQPDPHDRCLDIPEHLEPRQSASDYTSLPCNKQTSRHGSSNRTRLSMLTRCCSPCRCGLRTAMPCLCDESNGTLQLCAAQLCSRKLFRGAPSSPVRLFQMVGRIETVA